MIEELVKSFRVNDELIVLDNINNKKNIIYISFKRIYLRKILLWQKNITIYKYNNI